MRRTRWHHFEVMQKRKQKFSSRFAIFHGVSGSICLNIISKVDGNRFKFGFAPSLCLGVWNLEHCFLSHRAGNPVQTSCRNASDLERSAQSRECNTDHQAREMIA